MTTDFDFQGAEKLQWDLMFPMLSIIIKNSNIDESYDKNEIFILSRLRKLVLYGMVQSETDKLLSFLGSGRGIPLSLAIWIAGTHLVLFLISF